MFIMAIPITVFILFHESAQDPDTPTTVKHDGVSITQIGEILYTQYEKLQDIEQDAELIVVGKTIQNYSELAQSQAKVTEYDPLGEFLV